MQELSDREHSSFLAGCASSFLGPTTSGCHAGRGENICTNTSDGMTAILPDLYAVEGGKGAGWLPASCYRGKERKDFLLVNRKTQHGRRLKNKRLAVEVAQPDKEVKDALAPAWWPDFHLSNLHSRKEKTLTGCPDSHTHVTACAHTLTHKTNK